MFRADGVDVENDPYHEEGADVTGAQGRRAIILNYLSY